ncbi:MAG: hypothetical protein ABI409_14625, partial [Ramlibacter sp.]
MISALPLLATVNGNCARNAGPFRSRLAVALTCFAAAVVFATVAAASTPLLSWMGEPGVPAALRPVQIAADPALPLAAPAPEIRNRGRSCEGCGVVQSVRRLESAGGAPAAYELTVRLRDGSMRTSNVANTARWRVGDRIMLIGGVKSAAL